MLIATKWELTFMCASSNMVHTIISIPYASLIWKGFAYDGFHSGVNRS